MGSASYSRVFSSGPLLLLSLVIRYRDPGQNIRYHFALLNAVQFIDITDCSRTTNFRHVTDQSHASQYGPIYGPADCCYGLFMGYILGTDYFTDSQSVIGPPCFVSGRINVDVDVASALLRR